MAMNGIGAKRLWRWLLQRPRYAAVFLLAFVTPAVIAAVQLAEPDVLLYPLPQTVYDAEVHLTGLAEPYQTLEVELNGEIITRTVSNESGDFAVIMRPAPGQNRLRLVALGTMLPSGSDVHVFRYLPTPQPAKESPLVGVSVAKASPPIRIQVAPAAPVITVPPATSAANPVILSGTAAPSVNVNFYVNGRLTRSVTATGSGTFSTWVPLEDGANAIYATASNTLGETSPASNTVQVGYTHNVPRAQTGTILQDTVWTKGDGTAYSLTGNLTINPGITLWIQPGALVNAAGNYKITAQGSIVVAGSSTARAVLKASNTNCNGTNTSRSDWAGVEVPPGGLARLEYAEIQCALRGVYFNGGTGSIQRSKLLNSSVGVRTEAATAAAMISPTITAENEFRGNSHATWIVKNSRPVISGNNLITAKLVRDLDCRQHGRSPEPSYRVVNRESPLLKFKLQLLRCVLCQSGDYDARRTGKLVGRNRSWRDCNQHL